MNKKVLFVFISAIIFIILGGLLYLFRQDPKAIIEIVVFTVVTLGAIVCAFFNLKQGERK